MFSVTTAEIRWFIKGDIPAPVNNWLNKQNGLFEQQPDRNDIYLQIKNTDTPGIKFREGRFEVKQKIKELGVLEFSSTISGKAELWKKWSFESKESKIPEGPENKEWTQVAKARTLQKFIFDQNGKIRGGFNNYNSNGCNVELTKVIVNKNVWWTLGLETYGQPELLFENLVKAFEHLFNIEFPMVLNSQQSIGYPKWLTGYL